MADSSVAASGGDGLLVDRLANVVDGTVVFDLANFLVGILADFFGNLLDGILAMLCFQSVAERQSTLLRCHRRLLRQLRSGSPLDLFKQHFLNFFPLPQGHGSFLPTRCVF